jgi:hypothetical protein
MSTVLSLLVVTGIIGVLVALLLPASRGSREAGRRMHCHNNLKQIALALHHYEDEYGALPPAYTVDANGKPLHSWRTLILPYLEQKALYETIDLSKPWDDAANKAALETPLAVYRCYSVKCPPTHATYLAVVSAGGCLRPAHSRELAEITDDHNLTLAVVEVPAGKAVHWMSPRDVSEAEIVNQRTDPGLPHRGGFQAATVSGQTIFLSADTKPAKLRALMSIAGNDNAAAHDEY